MKIILQGHVTEPCNKMIHSFFQEIDELLSGSLTQEDEDAVLQELEEMTQVKCYTSWANKSIGIKTSIVSIFGWRRRNFPLTLISPQYNAPSAAKQTHARMRWVGVYTVGSCRCQHCIFNVAEFNLGKVRLETMLASCLSLEFTGVAMGLSQGHLGFYGYLIGVISFRSCYVLWYIMCLFLLPSQPSLW